jgi:hypothetical protein
MMRWKQYLLPAVVSLVVPLAAAADITPPASNPNAPPAPAKTGSANSTAPVAGCGACGAGGAGAYGGGGECGGKGKHHGHGLFGHLHNAFNCIESTNEAPNFRQHHGFGQIGGRIGGGHSGYADGFGNMGRRNGRGFFQPPFQAAPWYLYWPYDSHFQLPAPISGPYLPPQAYGYPGSFNPFFGTAPVMAPATLGYDPQALDPRYRQGGYAPYPQGYGAPAPGNFPMGTVPPVLPKK